ncbi:class I SAM-dependent methyltransferase [Paenibacillus sp. TAF43_2]|uniref:class I SAM-dependent methyltransferase n=1 Tax=Paenibacillus sp. TAF43_2 TaxID=3233069 RepID=UPI003F956C34
MRVLEIGAGTGQVATTIAKNWGVTLITLKLWENLNVIQQYVSEQGADNDVLALKANAELMPFPDEAFDAVFSIGSFFMIKDREKALKEIIRVTRTNGFFGIAEPMCTLNPVPSGLENFDIFYYHNKWLRTLDWNRNLIQGQGFLITDSYYFSDGHQWMLDNFRYYDGEKDFILHDEGRWLGLGLAVGKKLCR